MDGTTLLEVVRLASDGPVWKRPRPLPSPLRRRNDESPADCGLLGRVVGILEQGRIASLGHGSFLVRITRLG